MPAKNAAAKIINFRIYKTSTLAHKTFTIRSPNLPRRALTYLVDIQVILHT